MTVACVLELEYENEAVASSVHRALAPDNEPFVKAETRGAMVIAEMQAATPLKLLHTIEDYLACVAVAEQAVRAAKG